MKSTAKKFKPSAASIEARRVLMIRSREAKEVALKTAIRTGVMLTVNEVLLSFYKDESGAKDFRRFDEWKEAGFMVKKGESAYRVWGTPKQFSKNQEMENVATGNTESIESKFEFWPMCCIFNENQVEPLKAGAAPVEEAKTPQLCIGEKVETVLRSRQSGRFGEYMGEAHGADFVKVDGITFEIIRNVEAEALYYWTVINHNTGKEAYSAERLELIEAVREAAKNEEPAPLKKVPVAEFRNEVDALDRTYGTDRHACVCTAEKLNIMRILFFRLRRVQAITCARAKAEDLANRDSVVNTVRAFLGLDDTNPEPVPPTPTPTKKADKKPESSNVLPFTGTTKAAPAGDTAKAEKLRGLADKLTPKINACFAERLENTPKRYKQAAQKRAEGEHLRRTQAALLALANLAEAGTIPAELATINSTAAMHSLTNSQKKPVANGYHGYSVETGEPSSNDPAALAAWALLAPKTPEQLQADKLAEKMRGLAFSSIPGFFPSPAPVVDAIIDRAELEDGQNIADTSAGSGAILDGVRARNGVTIEAFECNHTLAEILTLKGYSVNKGDFLETTPAPIYDRILINPPFEQLQDAAHVRHSYEFLKEGGRLVAIMSPSAFFHSSKKAAAFREWFDSVSGMVEDMPEGSFKASGTNVSTKIIVINKPESTGTDDDTDEKPNPFVRADYQNRLEDKKDRLVERAQRAHKEAGALYERTRKLGEVIPLGQPILVGHHSEGRDRRFRASLDNSFRKSFALTKKGEYYAQKMQTVGTGGIASDDPEAITKLREKLAKAETYQAQMKAINASLRSGDDSALEKLGYNEAQITALKKPDFSGRVGIPSYRLQNNNAEIRRIKGRIDELEKLHKSPVLSFENDDIKVYVDDGRVCFDFKGGKPSEAARNIMKRECFKFSRYRGEWVRKATGNGLFSGQYIIDKLLKLDSIY